MEIAVFGGTFNPPTRSHEAIIQACLKEPAFDEVWVMPSGDRWDKPNMLEDQTRLRMLDIMKEQCFTDEPRLIVSDFEIELAHSYQRQTQTHQTVREIKRAYPEHHFSFVFGADSYQDMPNWRNGAQLQLTLGILVVPRAGYELPIEDDRVRHLCLGEAVNNISSTQVRAAIRAGQTITPYVCEPIEHFINDAGLYRPPVSSLV